MRKIHGRPLLPWWAYALYFALAIVSALTEMSKGSEMPKVQTVKIDENALARAIAKALKEAGRKGDSEIAHVNPREKQMLMAQGGAGTRNPSTGMPEFYEGGWGEPQGPTQDGSPLGGYSLGDLQGPNPDGSVFGGPPAGGEPQGPTPSGAPLGIGDLQGPTPSGEPLGGSSGSGGLAGVISNFVSKYPASPTGLATYGVAKGLGKLVGQPLDKWFGGRGVAEEAQSPSRGPYDPDGNNPMADLAQVQPAAQPAPAYLRPPVQEAPSNLGLQGLSDIQKRTMMATYGSQGAQSQYRTPEAMRAYGNLIARALIGDNNQVTGNETGTLPIEDQYLRQVFGIQKPNSAADLLDKLRPYWSQ